MRRVGEIILSKEGSLKVVTSRRIDGSFTSQDFVSCNFLGELKILDPDETLIIADQLKNFLKETKNNTIMANLFIDLLSQIEARAYELGIQSETLKENM